jgi:hypothetical protein
MSELIVLKKAKHVFQNQLNQICVFCPINKNFKFICPVFGVYKGVNCIVLIESWYNQKTETKIAKCEQGSTC